MGARMELVAGDLRSVLVALSTGDREALRDQTRFEAYLSLSGGMDPTWLDLFAEAVRLALDSEAPTDFLDARSELDGAGETADPMTVERVDPGWITAVASVPDPAIDGVAGRWIDRLEEEFGALHSEEKPWIRALAGQVVEFCRHADRAPDVVFVWALG
jgi:hypothetical protein